MRGHCGADRATRPPAAGRVDCESSKPARLYWGGRKFDALIDYLPQVDADVLCLQEITRTPDAPCEWPTYRDVGGDLLLRASLFDELREALPTHEAFFCAAARGDLFDGETAVLSEWGLATFVHKGVTVIGQTRINTLSSAQDRRHRGAGRRLRATVCAVAKSHELEIDAGGRRELRLRNADERQRITLRIGNHRIAGRIVMGVREQLRQVLSLVRRRQAER